MITEYIHYGTNEFDNDKFKKVENTLGGVNKPIGGLWASPVDVKYGWKAWCEDKKFYLHELDYYFKFTLAKEASVLNISTMHDFNMAVISYGFIEGKKFNFEEMVYKGVDAIQLNLSNEKGFNGDLCFALHGWDCDSILILNKDIITIV